MAPSEPTFWYHTWCSSLLDCTRVVWPIGCNGGRGASLPRLGYKILELLSFSPSPSPSFSGQSKLPRYEQPYTEVHLARDSSLLPTANLRSWPPVQVKLLENFHLDQRLDCNPMRNPELERPRPVVPKFPTLRQCEIINVCYFEMPSLRSLWDSNR